MKRVGAFFDIDRTVLEVNSGAKWVEYQWRTRKMSMPQFVRAMGWLFQYRFGLLDFSAMTRRLLADYEGQPVAPLAHEIETWFRAEIVDSICLEARRKIAEHQCQGHVVALLTSATPYLSRPLASILAVEHILCTQVAVAQGRFTGATIEPVCYGPGKVVHAECFAERNGVDLDRSFFYTDSYSDRPMLERVGEPRVVNPDPRLRWLAKRRGWQVALWASGGSQPGGD